MYHSSRSATFRTKMVALAAGTGMLLGSSMVIAPTAMAKPPVSEKGNDLECSSPHGIHPLKNRGNQIITVDGAYGPGITTGGGVITVNGYGFTDKTEDTPGFKINDHSPEDQDGEPFWPEQPSEFGTKIAGDGRSYVPARDSLLPDSNGEYSIKFKLPEAGDSQGQIGMGMNWIRTLSANPYFSHYALFLVLSEKVAKASKDTRVTVGSFNSNGDKYSVNLKGTGFSPNAPVDLEYNCQALTSITTDSKGEFEASVGLPNAAVKDRFDRQLIAREKDSNGHLVRAAVGYNTETPGGSVASVVVPDNEKAEIENGAAPTKSEIDAVLAVAKKFVKRGDNYSYNAEENRIEIFTSGNNQTRHYQLSTFAKIKNNTTPDPKPEPKPQPNPGDTTPNGGSSSSSMIGIIVAVLALLGLGGAAFGAYNWARGQGLVP